MESPASSAAELVLGSRAAFDDEGEEESSWVWRRLAGGFGAGRLERGISAGEGSMGGMFSESRMTVAPERSGDVGTGGSGRGLFRSPGELGEVGLFWKRMEEIGVPGGVRRTGSCCEDKDEA